MTDDTSTEPAGGNSPVAQLGRRARGASHPDRGDVAALPVERLEAQLVSLAGQLAAGTYELLVLVGELDAVARGPCGVRCRARRGSPRCATSRSPPPAPQVRVARALRDWPRLDTAMRDGDMSYAKTRVLVPHLTNDNVTALVELATVTPAGRLGAAIAAWAHRHEDHDVIEARQHDARSRRGAPNPTAWSPSPPGSPPPKPARSAR